MYVCISILWLNLLYQRYVMYVQLIKVTALSVSGCSLRMSS